MTSPRILVFAYHDVGYECLEVLLARGANVVAVFTHEDDPNERVWFKSVVQLARARGVAVYTPESIAAPEWTERIRELQPELILSFYYRRLIAPAVLALARLGAYNMHGSLLPKYRGRAPVNWAVLNGETETGATLHVMVKRPDAGDIVDQEPVPIGPQETAREVFVKVTAAARTILERRLDDLLAGRASRRAQNEAEATYFGGRRPQDGCIDWHRDAAAIFNLVRAVTHPYPGAFSEYAGRELLVWWARPRADGAAAPGTVLAAAPLTVACGRGALEVAEWQWRGDAPHGDDTHGLAPGAVLGANVSANQGGAQA